MQRPSAPGADPGPTHGWGAADLWGRFLAAQRSERRERVGLWLGLLLLFVPAFYFLLYFKRYSSFARLGWGAWLGLVVFVKVFGLSDAVVHIESPHEGSAVAPNDPTELPLQAYLGKLLGAQYMDHYRVDGERLTIVYERHDGYFGNEEVIADLAISNGFSLLYRREVDDLTLRFPVGERWREAHLTRRTYREFFGVDEPTLRSFAAPDRLKQSPVYNVSEADKRRFVRRFLHDVAAPPAPAPVGTNAGGRP
jgi:hypothetical protein